MKSARLVLLFFALQLILVTSLSAEEKRFVADVTDGVQHVAVIGSEYAFDPNVIVLKVNVPVEFKAKKEGGFVPHDLIVSAPEAGMDFSLDLKSDWQVVNFTPTKVGTYQMDCLKKLLWFKSHKERGMHGVIEVVP
ncbi:MAG TPA: hypothetical protein VIR78_02245 [Malonomonas sp.]